MITTLYPFEVVVKELYPTLGLARHTEHGQRFAVYSYKGDFLLRDVYSNHQQTIVMPTHFQREELTNTLWEHFKSTPGHPMTYLVHGLGMDLESFQQFVLYVPLYESGQQLLHDQQVNFLVRPQEMFFGNVERESYKGPRFRRIG